MHLNPTVLSYLAEARIVDDHTVRRANPVAGHEAGGSRPVFRLLRIVNVHYFKRAVARLLPFAA